MNHKTLDAAFPTIVRFTGVGLAVIIVIAGVLGQGATNLASGGVLALGMILYKSVSDAAKGPDGDHAS